MFNFKIQIYEKKQEVFCFLGPLYPWKNKIAMEARLPDVRDFADVALVGRAQQQKVSVRVNKAGVQEVFRQIKEQAGLNFVYDKAQVATLPPVTLTMQGVTVDAVLKRVFQGSPFEYIYENSTVVIKNGLLFPRNREKWLSGESCRIKTGTRFRGYLSC